MKSAAWVLFTAVISGSALQAADAPTGLAERSTPPVPSGALPTTDAAIKAELRAIGPRIETQRTTAIYTALLPKEPYAGVTVARDVSYGPHERNVLDVFMSTAKGSNKPVVVFVHGGGFSRGSKRAPGSAFFDNIGVWAASHGLVGVTINYRLAPEFKFPSGVEDLTKVVAFLKKHAEEYGGDADRIVLWGHSAGAGHVGDYIAQTPKPGLAGAILTSGMYTAEDGGKLSTWKDYYGDDASKSAQVNAVPGLVKSRVPLFVTWAELDPPGFVPDTEKLVKSLDAAGRKPKSLRLMGHSHISETYAIGTPDEALSAPVLDFVQGLHRAR